MVFCRNFVAAVKVNGKVLRERSDHTVYLPFGSEYSILLKNLDSRRAAVRVEIDGADVLKGRRLIVEPNSRLELERFLEDDLDRGQRFRFVRKTREIAERRGDRLEDGLIRVEYWFEQPCHYFAWNHWTAPRYFDPFVVYGDNRTFDYTVTAGGGGGTLSCAGSCGGPAPDEGVTVPGSQSGQLFQPGSIGLLESQSQVVVLRLKGYQAKKPLYVHSRLTCPTCGRRSKSSANFCSGCGTALL